MSIYGNSALSHPNLVGASPPSLKPLSPPSEKGQRSEGVLSNSMASLLPTTLRGAPLQVLQSTGCTHLTFPIALQHREGKSQESYVQKEKLKLKKSSAGPSCLGWQEPRAAPAPVSCTARLHWGPSGEPLRLPQGSQVAPHTFQEVLLLTASLQVAPASGKDPDARRPEDRILDPIGTFGTYWNVLASFIFICIFF